jgi:hypothetical protein
MKTKKHDYRDFPQKKLLPVPGVRNFRWGWFRCTVTEKDVEIFKGVGDYELATKCWQALIGDDPIEDDSKVRTGYFGALHVAISSKAREGFYRGSAIFLPSKSRSVIAHEVYHAVTRCCDYCNIMEEEARAAFLSGWMINITDILGLKDEAN